MDQLGLVDCLRSAKGALTSNFRTLGSMCVPCTDNSCYPRSEFDHLWHLVREAGRPEPLALVELRYGAGWRSPEY